MTSYVSYLFIDDLSLVRDTTLPLISLNNFSLGPDTFLCPGSTMKLGGEDHFFHYWWSNGDTTRFTTIADTGTYWCTVDFGCSTYTDTIHVGPPPDLYDLIPPDTAVCEFPFVLHTAYSVPGMTWNDGSTADSLVITGPGGYSITATVCGVTRTDAILVTNYPLTSLNLGSDTTMCAGASLLLDAGPGFDSYAWSTGSTAQQLFLTNLQPGTYTYWVTVTRPCGPLSDTIRITVLGASGQLLPADTTVCPNAFPLLLTLPPGLSAATWSNGDTGATATLTAPGIYWVAAQSDCGPVQDTIQVAASAPLEPFSLGADTTICENTALTLVGPSGESQYHWSTGASTPYLTVSSEGLYSLTVTDVCGATATDEIQVTVEPAPPPRAFITGDTSLCIGGSLIPGVLYANTVYSLLWDDGSTTPDRPIRLPGMYAVTEYNRCGENRDSVYVRGCRGIVAFPSAFTPNGDGINDVFRPVVQDGRQVLSYTLSIYNCWGERVFLSTDYHRGWDGTVGGRPATMGIYFYRCTWKEEGNRAKEQVQNGDVALIH